MHLTAVIDREMVNHPELSPEDKVLAALKSSAWDEDRNQYVPTSWTVPALASATGLTFRRVSSVVERLNREGRVSSRRHRSGAVLWKLFDPMESHGGVSLYAGGN